MLASLKKKLINHGYVRDEQGSLIVFVLVVFSAMFLVGGTAVDLARHENLRSSMQYNLDRAVLAAASLKQVQDPDTVVQDYMSKVVTIEEFSVDVTSVVATNARTVSATATAILDTWFLSMAGINEMPITARSAASERIPNLEISLVLDVSGSMSGSKLSNLKTAAKEFVTTMMTGVDPDSVTISVVPFNQNVAPTDSIFNRLNIDQTQTLSNCLDFSDASFGDVEIDPTVKQKQGVYTALYGSFKDFDDGYETCVGGEKFEILAYGSDKSKLHTKIDNLATTGWTAAHLGMKWGLALLDPKFQSVADGMIADGEISAGLAGIPAAYEDHETLKVVILMGDGANTYEFRFKDDYRTQYSDLWEVVEEEPGAFTHLTYNGRTYTGSSYERYCGQYGIICHYGDPVEVINFFLNKPSNGQFYDITDKSWLTSVVFNLLKVALGTTSYRRLPWDEAWGQMPAEYYDQITGSNSFNDLVNVSSRQTSEADAVLSTSCTAAEDAGIIVYTIGYETNSTTSRKLKDCASTESHYYPAAGTDITTVFASIAASIQKLKLTQ